MPLNKELYQQAQRWYLEWNAADLRERIQKSSARLPGEGWNQFFDLWRFGQRMGLPFNWRERQEKLAALEHYYDCIHKLEVQRKRLSKAFLAKQA